MLFRSIWLSVYGSFANPNIVSPDSQTGLTSNTINSLVAGNIRSTGLGSDTASSGPRTFSTTGPTGNIVRVRSSGDVQIGTLSTAGHAILAADNGSITSGAIVGTGGVGIFTRNNATLGNVTTSGALWLGNSSQYFLVVPTYQISNFPFSQTPTGGSATLGMVRAGIIRGSARDNISFTSLNATGDILLSTGNSNTVGGNISGGDVVAGSTITLTAGQSTMVGNVSAAGATLLVGSQGAVSAANVVSTNGIVELSGGAGAAFNMILALSDVRVSGGAGQVTGGNISSTTGSVAGSGTGIDLANLTAAGDVLITSGTLARLGNVTGGGAASLTALNGNVQVAAVSAGDVDISATTGIVAGNVTALSGNVTLLTSNGDVLAGQITAHDDFTLNSAGKATLAGASAGDDKIGRASCRERVLMPV